MAKKSNANLGLPLFAARGSLGVDLIELKKNGKEPSSNYKVSEKSCRVIKFSSSGAKLAWCDGSLVQVMETSSKNIIFSKELGRTFAMSFSPDENIFSTWEPYAVTKDKPQGKSNLHMWNLTNGECIYDNVQKKMDGWEPMWLEKSNICAKQFGNTVNFYKDLNFKQPSTKLHIEKLDKFSLSPNAQPPCRVACFIRGSKGGPSSVRLFKYPRFSHGEALANKSFFKADTVDMLWNKQGTSLLLRTAVEVDTTGESYYGEQNLHYISAKGDSIIVTLSKKGPIYDVAWAPNSTQFCVVFGFMPAKACIFNLKCNPIFEFGPTPKNYCFFNPQGTLLALAGFGNLRGNMEIWDFQKQRQVTQFQSPDTTYFEWCSDGAHILTATTAPRMRVGNGYKLWHFKDGVRFVHEVDKELHEVLWQPKPEGTYKPPVIGEVSQKDLKAIISASKPASYVPPHARGNPAYAAAMNRIKDEEAEKPAEEQETSKSARRRRRKKETEANQAAEQGPSFGLPAAKTTEQQDAVAMARYLLSDASATQNKPPPAQNKPPATQNKPPATQFNDPNKKLKTLKKKLTAIEKLKKEQKEGKQLNQDQIAKMNSESSVLEQIKNFKI